ncbi:transglycosylase SLT domain-containing protein [Pseudaminobacter sp. NGMCC 1.201702]|uniref:transglycosylase SLT domain-containing protein n=1 Tax=Pseudaminobacter sp. NGMCC 1.201702 TaxID=3391825 RepID=UPI0039F031C6
MIRRLPILLALLSWPAFADIPTIDRTVLVASEARELRTAEIGRVDRDHYAKAQSITCSFFRPGQKNDPVSAARANPTIVGLVRRIAQEEHVDENQFLALVYQESRFNPCAGSSAGAIGLSQLMPGTASDLGVNPYDIEQNLRGGARFYRQQLCRFGGNVPLALAAYNSGRGNVQKYGGIPPFRETQTYVANIANQWLPALGGSDNSGMPVAYGDGTAFEAARDSTLNAMGLTSATSAGSGDVASWFAQLGAPPTGTIQDSWDHNSGARNANIEMLNRLLQLGSAFADLANIRNAITVSDMSGAHRSNRYDGPGLDDKRAVARLCDSWQGLAEDEEAKACTRKLDLGAGLQLIPD